jgi:hypothetical protein
MSNKKSEFIGKSAIGKNSVLHITVQAVKLLLVSLTHSISSNVFPCPGTLLVCIVGPVLVFLYQLWQ